MLFAVCSGLWPFAAGMNYVELIVNIFRIGRRLGAPDATAVKTVGGC
jgi:hypothetical protein